MDIPALSIEHESKILSQQVDLEKYYHNYPLLPQA